VLLTHPLNREDLPFHVTSGIIDSDVFFNAGNIPFFIKEDFEGVIPKGTPIAQLIPIKRYDWKMQIRSASSKALRNLGYFAYLARTKDFNYKRTMWHRKKYD
jgi:hypothetical protein